MNDQVASLAADLRRVSYWIYEGQTELAQAVLKGAQGKYKAIPPEVGCYQDIWREIAEIGKVGQGKDRAAERALTASVILLSSAL